MIYIRPSAHQQLKQDLAKFIRSNGGQARATTTSQQ
jgi:hypothetical protein